MTGRLVIMGSGETAPTMVGTHRGAIQAAGASELVVMDSPFGFQENAAQLTERLVDFFETSLGVSVDVASLPAVAADPIAVERFRTKLRTARVVFAGPGSPSYALEVWSAHAIGGLLVDVMRRGGSVTLASAAALTAGTHTIPVYEIYKVGAQPHWLTGLDLLSHFGIVAAVIPHWNNAEGGNHDTSRCYIGERRLAELRTQFACAVVGVDEHTAATFDGDEGTLAVSGKGTVTLRGETDRILVSGETVSLSEVRRQLGSVAPSRPAPEPTVGPAVGFEESLAGGDADGAISAILAVESQIEHEPALRGELRSMIVQLGDAASSGLVDARSVVGGFVDLLLELRRDARQAQRFAESDRIRDRLTELGVEVRDTPDGVEWVLESEDQNP